VNTKDFTLLYIEDDKDTHEWMQMMFEDRFKHYYQAFNGVEGLEIYKKHKPDIIVTDINMPLMDGLEMAQEIKKLDNEQAIIIMSAFDDKEILLKALNIGIDYFTPKPIDMDSLNERIDSVIKNISNKRELKRLQEKELQNLYYLAHYDTLTGIQNRFLFEENLQKALTRAKRMNYEVIFFFIDLDDFKTINDTYGHAAGDIVLKSVVQNIKKVIRTEDTFARISGDEFALIMEITSENNCNADLVAEKIINALSKDIQLNNKKINMSCSIGISCFPQDATTAQDLLQKADYAMYKAKNKGKSAYMYYQ